MQHLPGTEPEARNTAGLWTRLLSLRREKARRKTNPRVWVNPWGAPKPRPQIQMAAPNAFKNVASAGNQGGPGRSHRCGLWASEQEALCQREV